jgi:hypothetical protein
MMRFTESTLSRFAYNGSETAYLHRVPAERRFQLMQRQLESYVLHALEDFPVSSVFSYYRYEDGNIYSSPERNDLYLLDNQVDQRERGGLYLHNIKKALNMTVKHQGQVVLYYSPPGIVDFDNDPTSDYYRKEYRGGQLYLNYADGSKINSLAVSVSDEGDEWIRALIPTVWEKAHAQPTELDQIRMFMESPVSTRYDIDDFIFLNESMFNSNAVIYRNNHDEVFTLGDIIEAMRSAIAGKLRPSINVMSQKTIETLQSNTITQKMMDFMYLSLAQQIMKMRGTSSIKIGGYCSGDKVTKSELLKLLGVSLDLPESLDFEAIFSSFSTVFRRLHQKEDKDEYGSRTFTCGECGGKHTRPAHELIKICPVTETEMKKC